MIAVLALHYQNDVVHPDGKIKVGLSADSAARAGLLSAALALLAGARARHWPVVHVRVAYRSDYADLQTNAPILQRVKEIGAVADGSWGAQFYADLAPQALSTQEFVVTHGRINAFYDSPLAQVLSALQVTQLVVAGVSTHSVVESTVRDAVDRGYTVTVAHDACASAQVAQHQASLDNLRLIATVRSVAEVMA